MAKILINKSHLFHNLKLIEQKVGNKNKISVVLKDNAYGHGLKEIALLCKEFGIKNAVVRNFWEAKEIETLFETILILADTNVQSYSHTFHIAINSLEEIECIPKNYKIHLKVDSGMHRNGIDINELETAFLRAIDNNLTVSGVFTHHRSADEIGSDFFWQNENFKVIKNEVKKICEKLFLPIPSFHSFNSSATFRSNFCEDDMVRVGICLYGYLETDEIFPMPDLKPVLSLYTNKISTRSVYKNQKIGYGGSYKIPYDMKISTYDVGYGDGFLRINENQKYTTPQGFDLIGRVSMDNLCLNSQDNVVCLFDNVKELAKIHNTITYEILTSLKPNIKREIV